MGRSLFISISWGCTHVDGNVDLFFWIIFQWWLQDVSQLHLPLWLKRGWVAQSEKIGGDGSEIEICSSGRRSEVKGLLSHIYRGWLIYMLGLIQLILLGMMITHSRESYQPTIVFVWMTWVCLVGVWAFFLDGKCSIWETSRKYDPSSTRTALSCLRKRPLLKIAAAAWYSHLIYLDIINTLPCVAPKWQCHFRSKFQARIQNYEFKLNEFISSRMN